MLETRIAELRKKRKISQEELAEMLSTSRQAVSKWERGEAYPDIDRLKELAALFSVSIDYLLGYDAESVSVKSFLDRLNKSMESGKDEIGTEELRLAILSNPNHFELLVTAMEYLLLFWSSNHDVARIEMAIEFGKKALLIYQEENNKGISSSSIERGIAFAYLAKGDPQSAKEYITQNKIPEAEVILLECECELGNSKEASKMASNMFLESINSIGDAQFVQARLLLEEDKVEEALEVAEWTISFIKSLAKTQDFFLGGVYCLTFLKAVSERYLGRDYSSSLAFLLENKDSTGFFDDNTDDIRFYHGEKATFLTMIKTIEETLFEKVVQPMKGKPAYGDCLAIYETVFGGKNDG